MRIIALLFFIFICSKLNAQNGYVVMKGSDSTIVGFVRHLPPLNGTIPAIEVWQTKKDKHPLKIPKTRLSEYAIKKDTVRVLHQFKPFQSTQTYFEFVEARILSRGKVSLLFIPNYVNASRISNYTGGGIVPAIIDEMMGNYSYMYVLENSEGYSALPSKKAELKDALMDYFPEKFVEKYASVYGEITYKSVEEMVTFYNSK